MSSSAQATQISARFKYASFYRRFQSFQSLFGSLFFLVSNSVSISFNRFQNTGAKLFCILFLLELPEFASIGTNNGLNSSLDIRSHRQSQLGVIVSWSLMQIQEVSIYWRQARRISTDTQGKCGRNFLQFLILRFHFFKVFWGRHGFRLRNRKL